MDVAEYLNESNGFMLKDSESYSLMPEDQESEEVGDVDEFES